MNIFPVVVSNTYPTAGKPIPNCSRPLQEGIKTSTIAFTADSGHEQRRQKAAPKRTFQPVYNVLTLDQYRTLRDFFMQMTDVHSFTWEHPVEKTTFLVKFTMDTFAGENIGHGPSGALYKLQLQLEQVWQ
jgi:phage-related protein